MIGFGDRSPPNLYFMQDLNKEEYIAAGRIVRTHGTQGWVGVTVYSGFGDRFDGYKVLYIKGARGIEGKILTGIEEQPDAVLLKFKGVDDREAAKDLVGAELMIPESQKLELPEDFYFIDDLIGLEVYDTGGKLLGKIRDVMVMSGNDIYVVGEGEQEILIPAVGEFVKEVDIGSGKMVVQLWEGM